MSAYITKSRYKYICLACKADLSSQLNFPAQWTKVMTFGPDNNKQIQHRAYFITSLIARFMGPTWGPSGADRTQVGPIDLAIWDAYWKYTRLSFQIITTKKRWSHRALIYDDLFIYLISLSLSTSFYIESSIYHASKSFCKLRLPLHLFFSTNMLTSHFLHVFCLPFFVHLMQPPILHSEKRGYITTIHIIQSTLCI